VTNDQPIGSSRRLKAPAHAYSALLISLLGLWLLAPFLRMLHFEEVTQAVLVTVTVVAASYAMSNQGKSFFLIIGVGLLFAIGTWIDASRLEVEVGAWSATTGAVFYGVVAYELLVDILSKKSRVDMNLINGAIAVYLLIGICFAYIYALLFSFDPDAFRGLAEGTTTGPEFAYFSFVTLTTLGYGDITPVTSWSASFANMEAVVGQLYLTVLVARLVGMHISQESAS
jgi:voltage-gated potassium channel